MLLWGITGIKKGMLATEDSDFVESEHPRGQFKKTSKAKRFRDALKEQGEKASSAKKLKIRRLKERLRGFAKVVDSETDIDFQGLRIHIENPGGSIREGISPDGKPFRVELTHPYGFIYETQGCDGEEVDCFIGPSKDAGRVFIVWDKWQEEDKCFLGFDDGDQVHDAFCQNYNDPDKFLGPMTEMSMDRFKDRIKNHKQGTRIE